MSHKSLPRIASTSDAKSTAPFLIPAPKLQQLIGISAVTLWRWRQDEQAGFPQAITINGRNYFSWAEVHDWLARQQQVARPSLAR